MITENNVPAHRQAKKYSHNKRSCSRPSLSQSTRCGLWIMDGYPIWSLNEYLISVADYFSRSIIAAYFVESLTRENIISVLDRMQFAYGRPKAIAIEADRELIMGLTTWAHVNGEKLVVSSSWPPEWVERHYRENTHVGGLEPRTVRQSTLTAQPRGEEE